MRTALKTAGVAAVAVAALFLALTAYFLIYPANDADGAEHARKTWPTCQVEDGSTQDHCKWDAAKQGNGQGRSYVTWDHGQHGRYLDTGETW